MAEVVQLLIQSIYTAVTVLLLTEYRHTGAALPSSWHSLHPYPPAYFIQLLHCRHCWACKRDACCPMGYLLSPLRSLDPVHSTGTSCRCSLNLTHSFPCLAWTCAYPSEVHRWTLEGPLYFYLLTLGLPLWILLPLKHSCDKSMCKGNWITPNNLQMHCKYLKNCGSPLLFGTFQTCSALCMYPQTAN